MAFNINEFKSQLTGGGARANLFQVQILNPVDPVADFKVPFMVKAANIPSSDISSFKTTYFGRTIAYAGTRTFATWQVTVINDEDYQIRNSMEAWMNAINSHESNVSGLPQDYKTDALITHYSKNGDPLRSYKFEGLFPTSVSTMAMTWDGADAIQEFTVDFDYDMWTVEGNTGIPTT
jgi:hypothetical protein